VSAAEVRDYLTREVPAAAKRVGGMQNPPSSSRRQRGAPLHALSGS
jgi:hypothetical protein